MKSKKLKNKIAIVAGGSGQIGKNTVDVLLANGAKVINLDFVEKKFKKKQIDQEKKFTNKIT